MTFASVRKWLVDSTVLEPSLLEGAGFDTLVAERIGACGGTESAYIATLGRSPEEVDRLIAGIAVPETWLFRYPRSFELLVDTARARLAAGAQHLRMASIGCATGQEAWCMAMCALHAGWTTDRVSVVGIDRNRAFLDTAREGAYGAGSIRSEIPAWAMHSLRRTGETITVEPSVRASVRFTLADVATTDAIRALGPLDVVFCRNLLIYLSAAARTDVLSAICDALVPGGLLFTGHAEQILRGVPSLRPVQAPHAFALERIDGAPQAPAARTTGVRRVTPAPAPPPPARTAPARAPHPAPVASLDDARDLADAGRTADAEAMVRAIVARHGPTAPALELLGMIRMAANDTAGARRSFEQAVYLEPTRATSLLQLAIITERSGDRARAAALWDRATRASATADREGRA